MKAKANKKFTKGPKKTSPKRTTNRAKQIQTVFDKLGIADEASRNAFRPIHQLPPETGIDYIITLSGSTQSY